MSFEEFVEQLRSDIPAAIEKSNEKVKNELPDIFELKPASRQRSLLLNPDEAKKMLRGLIEAQVKISTFLDVVSAVRGDETQGELRITEVTRGHRVDNRDYILKAMMEGVYVDDYRVLVGKPERMGEDMRNQVSQDPFYKMLNLHAFRQKAHLV